MKVSAGYVQDVEGEWKVHYGTNDVEVRRNNSGRFTLELPNVRSLIPPVVTVTSGNDPSVTIAVQGAINRDPGTGDLVAPTCSILIRDLQRNWVDSPFHFVCLTVPPFNSDA